jgi:hypothetical protein
MVLVRNTSDRTVREPNPDGEEHPYPGLPLTNAAAALVGLKLGQTTYIANSLPYAQVLGCEYEWNRKLGSCITLL